jgi:transmembrane sensor
VIAELNRYHRGLILIGDQTLRERPVSGVFRTDRPAEAVAALENSLELRSTRLTEYLIVRHR